MNVAASARHTAEYAIRGGDEIGEFRAIGRPERVDRQ